MENYDAFTAGVEAGGLINTSEIKALICFLLLKIDAPVSRELCREVLQEQGIANYFDVSEAIAELIKSGNISTDFTDDDEVMYLTAIGKGAAELLVRDVPRTVREKAFSSLHDAVTRLRRERETKIEITPSGSGYNVSFSVSAGDDELMHLSVYAADLDQATGFKENFLKDPVRVYSGIISSLTV
ncbi:MAG: DUF4364 family protein [Clostridia bacterium]|nr:DUF4364 family protein [Clostridia bacterium]